MELKEYLGIIAKRIWLLVGVTIVVGVGAYSFTVSQPKSYDASAYVNVIVKQQEQLKPEFYEYDNYYTIQSSSLFSDTVVTWLQDPSNVMEVYNDAKVETPNVKLKNFSKLIKVSKKQGGAIQITLNDKDKNAAENLVNSTVRFIQNKTDQWLKQGLIKNVSIDASQTVVLQYIPSITLNTVIGLVVGFILGLALVFFVDYMKREGR